MKVRVKQDIMRLNIKGDQELLFIEAGEYPVVRLLERGRLIIRINDEYADVAVTSIVSFKEVDVIEEGFWRGEPWSKQILKNSVPTPSVSTNDW